MLERYSKTKAFMFVRKRKAARKKRKVVEEHGSLPEDYDGENEEDIQAEKDMPSYDEHAFTFTTFERVGWQSIHSAKTNTVDSALHRRMWSTRS